MLLEQMRFVQIPFETIDPQTLERLVEDFVTRDGTDYGLEERTLEEKKGMELADSQSQPALLDRCWGLLEPEVRSAAKHRLDAKGITIPFPQHHMHLYQAER